ncbi:unnamed protein product, partial [Amoebophrya sp. A25]
PPSSRPLEIARPPSGGANAFLPSGTTRQGGDAAGNEVVRSWDGAAINAPGSDSGIYHAPTSTSTLNNLFNPTATRSHSTTGRASPSSRRWRGRRQPGNWTASSDEETRHGPQFIVPSPGRRRLFDDVRSTTIASRERQEQDEFNVEQFQTGATTAGGGSGNSTRVSQPARSPFGSPEGATVHDHVEVGQEDGYGFIDEDHDASLSDEDDEDDPPTRPQASTRENEWRGMRENDGGVSREEQRSRGAAGGGGGTTSAPDAFQESSDSRGAGEIQDPYVQSVRTHPVRSNLFAVLLAGHPPNADSYIALCERPPLRL